MKYVFINNILSSLFILIHFDFNTVYKNLIVFKKNVWLELYKLASYAIKLFNHKQFKIQLLNQN